MLMLTMWLSWQRSPMLPSKDDVVDGGGDGAMELGSEVGAFEGLAELPVTRRGVGGEGDGAVAGDGLERESLTAHLGVAGELPHGAPVALHAHPGGARPLHVHLLHVARARYVRHQHQDEPGVAVDGEAHPPMLYARYPEQDHEENETSEGVYDPQMKDISRRVFNPKV